MYLYILYYNIKKIKSVQISEYNFSQNRHILLKMGIEKKSSFCCKSDILANSIMKSKNFYQLTKKVNIYMATTPIKKNELLHKQVGTVQVKLAEKSTMGKCGLHRHHMD